MIKIDACGLSCPQPVILTMNAMQEGDTALQVLVDSACACENVQRLAENKGYKIEIERFEEEKVQLTLTR